MSKLFGKFITGSDYGTVLGLNVTKKLLKAHGGRIWAEPLPGGGKAFRFTVRVDEVPEAPAATADA